MQKLCSSFLVCHLKSDHTYEGNLRLAALVHDCAVEILDAVCDESGGPAAARDVPPHITQILLGVAGMAVEISTSSKV
jgi:hypothetical protein